MRTQKQVLDNNQVLEKAIPTRAMKGGINIFVNDDDEDSKSVTSKFRFTNFLGHKRTDGTSTLSGSSILGVLCMFEFKLVRCSVPSDDSMGLWFMTCRPKVYEYLGLTHLLPPRR